MASVIKHIRIDGLWGKYNVNWKNLDPAVNILIGINGSGKSTMLSMIEAFLGGQSLRFQRIDAQFSFSLEKSVATITINDKQKELFLKNEGQGIVGQENNFNFASINTFDKPIEQVKNSDESKSQLLRDLEDVLYKIEENSLSFTDYRLKATTDPERANEINDNIQTLFSIINSMFAHTKKRIGYNGNNIVFRIEERTIWLKDLSSGEKQLLLILFKVFLMDKQPCVLLMDEPEISLHIEWQQKLIKTILQLNPNCQLIIATHSPSIFGNGWNDKLVFMDDLLEEI